MSIWDTISVDVTVNYDDVMEAHESALKAGRSPDMLTLVGEVDVDDALNEFTVDQLRDALGREETGWTPDQVDAIRDTFAALLQGDCSTASALLKRIFDHAAQIAAAEDGIRLGSLRRAA